MYDCCVIDVSFHIKELHEIVPGDVLLTGGTMFSAANTRRSLVLGMRHNLGSMPKSITLTRLTSSGAVRTSTFTSNAEFKVEKQAEYCQNE